MKIHSGDEKECRIGCCQSCCGQPGWAYFPDHYRAPLCCGYMCTCCNIEKESWGELHFDIVTTHFYGGTFLPCGILFGSASEETQLGWSLSELTGSNVYAAAIHAIERGDFESLSRLVSSNVGAGILGPDDITTITRRFRQDAKVEQFNPCCPYFCCVCFPEYRYRYVEAEDGKSLLEVLQPSSGMDPRGRSAMLAALGWVSAPARSDTDEAKLAKRCKAISATTLAGDHFRLENWWQQPDLKLALREQNPGAATTGSDAAWLSNPSAFDLIPGGTEGGGDGSDQEIKWWISSEQRHGRSGNVFIVHRIAPSSNGLATVATSGGDADAPRRVCSISSC